MEVFRAKGPIISTPAVSGARVFFGSSDHNVYAVDEGSGELRWKFATHGRVTASPAVADGTVYIGSFDGNFYALDAASGALRWKFATEGERRFAGATCMAPSRQRKRCPIRSICFCPRR